MEVKILLWVIVWNPNKAIDIGRWSICGESRLERFHCIYYKGTWDRIGLSTLIRVSGKIKWPYWTREDKRKILFNAAKSSCSSLSYPRCQWWRHRHQICIKSQAWWLYSAAPLGSHTVGTMARYSTQSHYPDIELTGSLPYAERQAR